MRWQVVIAHTIPCPSIEARQIKPALAMEQSSTMFCQQSHEAVKNHTNSVTLPYVIERNAFVPWLAMEEMFLHTSKNFALPLATKIVL